MAVSSRRLLRLLGLIGLSIASLLIVLLVSLQIPEVATWVARRLLTQVPLNPGYHLKVGRINGNWLTSLGGRDLTLVYQGRTLVEIEQFRIGYSLPGLLGESQIGSLSIDSALLVARRESSGWDIANAFAEGPEGDTTGGGGLIISRLEVENVSVQAYLSSDSLIRVRDLTLQGRDVVLGERVRLRVDTVHATIIPPDKPQLPIDVAASGAITDELIQLTSLRIESPRSSVAGHAILPRDFDQPELASKLDVGLRAAPLALADVSLFYPDVARDGRLQLQIDAAGDGKRAIGTVTAQLNDAMLRVKGSTLLGSNAPASYQVSGELDQVDPSKLLGAAPKGSLTGELELNLQGKRLATADGLVMLRLSRSRLGGTRIPTLRLSAEMDRGRAQVNLRGQITEAMVRADGWVRPFDSVPSYRLTGLARRIPGTSKLASALTDGSGDPELTADFRVEGTGIDPDQASLSGRLKLAAVRQGGEPVPLGTTAIRLDDGRLRVRPDLRVAGGRISALVLATLGDTIRYEVRNGVFENLELGQLIEDTLAAPISGQFALQGRGISPEEAIATVRLELEELRYGERRLTDIAARGRLRNGRTVLGLTGRMQGGTVDVAGAARPFDGPVRFSIDSAKLTRVDLGDFFKRPEWSGAVTLRATGNGRWGKDIRLVRGKVVIEPSRLGHIALTGGSITAELSNGRLSYDASLRSGSGTVALTGEGRPLDSVPSIRVQQGLVESLDLGELLGRPDLLTALNAKVTASAVGTQLDSMRGQLRVQLLQSRINQARLGPGSLSLTLADGELQGGVRLEGPDAQLVADLSGALTRATQRIGAEGTIRFEQLARWTGDSAPNGRLEGKFALQAAADSAGLVNASGTVTAVGGLGRVRLQTFHAVLEPSQGAIVFDTIIVRSNVASFDGAGSLAMRDTGSADTLRLVGQTGDVNALATLVGIDSLTLDSARVSLALTGLPDRRRIAGRATAHRLLYFSTLIEELEANLGGTIDSSGLGAIAGRVSVQGLATGDLTVTEGQFAGRYDSMITFQGTAELGDDVRLEVALEGEAAGDTTTLQLRRLRLDEGGRRWALRRATRVQLRPEAVEIQNFAFQTTGSSVALDGVLAFNDTSNLSLQIDSVELGTLERVGLAPVPGRLSGALRLTGPPSSPVMAGDLALTLHDGEEENLGRIRSALEWTRRGLRLNAVAAHRRRGGLTLQGTLPWGFTLGSEDTSGILGVRREPGDTLHLAVQADSFQIALLRPFIPPEVAQRVHGRLAADARIRGTPERPSAEGEFQLTRLGFRVPAINVRYQRGRIIGGLAGDVLRIDTLLLHTDSDEELAAQGQVLLRPLSNPSLDLRARLRDFLVSNSSQLQARASGQLRLAGTIDTPVVTGRLRVDRAEYTAGGATGLAVEDVQLTPEDRREVARHFGPAVLARADDRGGFLDRFRLDLDLRLPSQVWFRQPRAPELNVEVAGRIRLRQEPGEDMRFFGAVEPLPGRSTLDVYGRTFQLTGGQIVFNGPTDEIRINVAAEYQVPTQSTAEGEGVIINVAATGNPDSISLALSSEPEMSEDDMISYVVTGRPSSDNPLVTRSEDGTGGGELALGQLTEAISSAVGQELGFDVFHIRQDGTNGLTLTAGRYLTPQLYLSLQQPLEFSGQDPLAPGTNLGPGFELQYRMQPWLRVLLQGGSLPAGVLLRGRYAY